jgi:hypothetical protein
MRVLRRVVRLVVRVVRLVVRVVRLVVRVKVFVKSDMERMRRKRR